MMVHGDEGLRVLRPWQELVDVLVEVDLEGEALVFSRFTVSMPLEELERFSDLSSLVGVKIGLLRTDLPDRRYIVTDPKHDSKRADAHQDHREVSRDA